MRFFTRHSDIELDTAAFASQVRDTYVEAPDEATASRHLAAISASAQQLADQDAQVSSSNKEPRPEARVLGARNRRRYAMTRNRGVVAIAKLATAAVASMALMTGLAFAGVTLPTAAQSAFDRVGVNLPNQGDEHAQQQSSDTSQAVLGVIADRDSFASGCEFGQAVAAAASGKEPAADACDRDGETSAARKGKDNDDGASAQNNGEAQNEFGQQTSTDAKENARNDGRAFGERQRERALDHARTKSGQSLGAPESPGAQSNGQSQSETGRSIAESRSQGAGENGEARSQEGQSIGQSKSGGNRP